MPYRPKPASTSLRGRQGEEAVCAIIRSQGLEVLERNFRTWRGEVDIIAGDQQVLCFIEVKSWSRELWPDVARSVNARKRQRIRQTAGAWLAQNPGHQSVPQLRFDLVLYDPSDGGFEWLRGALDY